MNKDLNKVIWLLGPITIFLIPYISRIITDQAYTFMYMESGWVELSTVVFLVFTIIFSILFIKNHNFLDQSWLKVWFILLILGSIYFAGEEASWGQHFFGWSTPDAWSVINDQQETNLHNTSAIFDQIPRTLLSLAAVIGGFLVPLFQKISNKYPAPGTAQYWFWPTYVCIPVAILSLVVSWHEKAYEIFGSEVPSILDIRSGEVKESLLALFMMIYALSVWYRNKNYIKKH